jgi:hypothetical protein
MLLLSGCVVPDSLVVKTPAAQTTATSSHPAPAPQAATTPNTMLQGATQAINPHLAAALGYAPADTQHFAYTDWTILKQVAGVSQLTSASPFDERFDFMRHLAVDQQAAGSAFGSSYFVKHAEVWGWDSTDLLWEANIQGEGAPLFALRFGDDFDFAPVLDASSSAATAKAPLLPATPASSSITTISPSMSIGCPPLNLPSSTSPISSRRNSFSSPPRPMR